MAVKKNVKQKIDFRAVFIFAEFVCSERMIAQTLEIGMPLRKSDSGVSIEFIGATKYFHRNGVKIHYIEIQVHQL